MKILNLISIIVSNLYPLGRELLPWPIIKSKTYLTQLIIK